MKEIKWEDMFNSSHKIWGHIGEVHKAAENNGYKYFWWCGRPWETKTGKDLSESKE